MSDHNPFAPPKATADPPEGRGLVFSEEGVRVVSSLASWMRGLAIFFFVAVAFIVLGTCAIVVSPGPGGAKAGAGLAMVVIAVGLGAAASWLRSAASGFERGVMSDDEIPLGQGFGSLRAYLILMGIVGILSLLMQLYQLSEVM